MLILADIDVTGIDVGPLRQGIARLLLRARKQLIVPVARARARLLVEYVNPVFRAEAGPAISNLSDETEFSRIEVRVVSRSKRCDGNVSNS